MRPIWLSFLLVTAVHAAELPRVAASRVTTGTVMCPYSTGHVGAIVTQVDGLGLAGAKGIDVTIASKSPTQVRLCLILPEGPVRFRYVVFSSQSWKRRLVLPLEAFDVDPRASKDKVPAGGALMIVDCPGFMRDRLDNVIALGPVKVLDAAPPLPADEVAPGPESERDPLFRRILGGWLGKVAGGAVGMPYEGKLEARLAEVDKIARAGLPVDGWGFGPDDDSSFEVQHLLVVKDRGASFSGPDLVRSWLRTFSREYLWKTERYALGLISKGIVPPMSGENPYGESLCARIRADLWGYLAPGEPARALEFVGRDAPIANCREGIRAAELFATLVSLAFLGGSVESLVEASIEAQPEKESANLAVARSCLADFRAGKPLEEALGNLKRDTLDLAVKRDSTDAWVQAVPNTGLTLLALLYGRGDFAKTVALAACLGWDTDCNAATAGCIVGVLGTDAVVPPAFRDRLHDRLRATVAGREHWSLRRLAQETRQAVDQVKIGR